MRIIDSEGIERYINILDNPINCTKAGRAFTHDNDNWEIVEYREDESRTLLCFIFNPIHRNKVVHFL